MSKEESKFGFKDKNKAEETITLLEEHDMQYRKLTVRGLLGRAKRVLTSKFNVVIVEEFLIRIKFVFSDKSRRKDQKYNRSNGCFREMA